MKQLDTGPQFYNQPDGANPRARWLATPMSALRHTSINRNGDVMQFSSTGKAAQSHSGNTRSAKRYVGHSSSRPAPQRRASHVESYPHRQVPPPVSDPSTFSARSQSTLHRSRVTPWSARLASALIIICALATLMRLTSLFTPLLDTPVGVEATHAVFANLLAGKIEGALDGVRMLPAPAPWHGEAPANPSAGLPLYGWLTSLLIRYLGAGDWTARLLSTLFSLIAGIALFSIVRRTAGVRAALYACLLFTIAPLSIILGQQFSPSALLLAAQAGALLSLVKWRDTVTVDHHQGSGWAFTVAVLAAGGAALLDPGSIFLILPAAYIVLSPRADEQPSLLNIRRGRPTGQGWRDTWRTSPNHGKLAGYIGTIVGAAAMWWLFTSGSEGLTLTVGDGGGGIGAAINSLFQAGTYAQVIGLLVEKVLTIGGLLLLAAGILHAARPPLQIFFHVWLAAGLLHVLADASRLGRHDDVLLPLLLPVCALVGIGAAWSGSFPARIWLAVTEQRRERDSEYHVSPHTAWLLDLPEERVETDKPSRPQAQLALGKSVAQRARQAGAKARRTWLIGLGHLLILGAFALMALSGWKPVSARLQPGVAAIELRDAGAGISAAIPKDARLIIAGPSAAELFYASGHTGWALSRDEFNMGTVQALQREGASYLLSADQEWLGRQPDYRGLLTDYSVKQLTRTYILFDLNTKPALSDRLYFLESGHTLGGDFRPFWESKGGVQKLGYPISEEMQESSPLDGQTRTVQYFERGILELHQEYANTKDSVMLASVGRWVTKGRDFPRVTPFKNTPDRAYFPQTGHTLKEAFFRYWLREGGLALFGYPISEELPEISPADGHVYTVQYFERARLEWHPTEAGTPKEVQLGLIGKQALEMRK